MRQPGRGGRCRLATSACLAQRYPGAAGLFALVLNEPETAVAAMGAGLVRRMPARGMSATRSAGCSPLLEWTMACRGYCGACPRAGQASGESSGPDDGVFPLFWTPN